MSDTAVLHVICVPENGLEGAGLTPSQRAWATANGFSGKRGKLLALPATDGTVSGYLFGLGTAEANPTLVTGLASAALPKGTYRLEGSIADPTLAAIGFRLGAYRFDRYRQAVEAPILELPSGADAAEVDRLVEAAGIARDLINTPPNDLGPDAFEAEIQAFAEARDMDIRVITGDDLLAENFPMIHAVGRASAEAPRLVDLRWGREGDPKVTLVGKGVTFDTGGLDIKTAAGMLIMKKDMGGAANVLGLAHAIVSAGLNVRLRVLIPIVENAIAGQSFRPGDILKSRKGLTVEIGNTDAEGRLILADALALADEEKPDLLLDMATLTGAARVALGPELPPLYSSDETLARDLVASGMASDDPLWHMPLWSPYDAMMSSRTADVNNAGSGGFAGSVTAALFLRRFVNPATTWVHLDIYGWAPEGRAGRSFGGTDQGIRAVYNLLKSRYAK
ncbi:MAG: leucyl aminopeptidase family protein [Candidatus Devosia phytovorans]|uniref:Leucyl aminopeptidase family protein n=1 Tax=Candidatus Devosia phytovorans TaxID=3121372 RepID=A0AAJ6AZ95_9HYPH|nr:leucyl aminopeptidase family protein [Devosia sp.]WEK03561.1 MAG: leucyl aminopeptidase family protein [Devosia sp.]